LSVLSIAASERKFYLRGCLLVLAAGLCWSFTGLMMRLATHSDAWQYLGYRSIGIGLTAVLWGRWQGGSGPIAGLIGLRSLGLAAVLAISLASTTFILAAKSTTIANTLFLSSCSPLLAAILGFVFLGEGLSRQILAAIGVGMIGIIVMVSGEISAGNQFGNLMAFCSALGFAGYTTCLRRAGGRDLSSVVFGYASLTAILAVAATLAGGRPLLPPAADILIALLNGIVPLGIGTIFYQKGAPFIPAVGLAFLSQTEAVFGPLWVWLFLGETPLPSTLAGGAIILSAVIVMALAGANQQRKTGRE
jgi:DME family drug/metabolite transporter